MHCFQFAALAASGADIDIPAFLADMEEDDELDEIDLSPWLSERELAATADYEMTRLKNMKLNYEMLLKLGKYSPDYYTDLICIIPILAILSQYSDILIGISFFRNLCESV